MNASSHDQNTNSFPVQELETLEAAIRACAQCLTTLQRRQTALTDALEELTRPAAPGVAVAMPANTFGPGVRYRGEFVRCWSYIDIYTVVLERLWKDHPHRRDAMAAAVSSCGSTRVYVARSAQALFPFRSLAWAQRYSRRLVDDWYVDTNLNLERMRRILPVAVRAAGLKWGEDVFAYWRPTRLPS